MMFRCHFFIIGLAILTSASASAKEISAPFTASATVSNPKAGNGDFIYRLTLTNKSSTNICIEAAAFPSSIEYRGTGLSIHPPSGEIEGIDLGEITDFEELRSKNSVLVIFPNKSISGFFFINKVIEINRNGIYNLIHRIAYIDCSKLKFAPDINSWSKYWKANGSVTYIQSNFRND